MFKMDYLADTGDIAGLIAVLRHAGAAPFRRAQAAQVLGSMDDTRLAELLICSHLADPDSGVRVAALEALKNVTGAETQLALSSYYVAPGELDEWLVEAANEAEVMALLWERQDFTAEFLQESHSSLRLPDNPASLVQVLRNPAKSAQVRARAARMLGQLHAVDETEMLVRALQEDPDECVRAAAKDALHELHGENSGLVVKSYHSAQPYADAWLRESTGLGEGQFDEEEEDTLLIPNSDGERSGNPLSEIDFGGLISILKSNAPTALRIKAVRLLQYNQDARAVEWLLLTALSDDDPQVSEAARQILGEMFPEEAQQMLQDFRAAYQLEEEEWGGEIGGDEEDVQTRSQRLLENQPPSIQTEKNALPGVITFLLLVLAATVLVYYFTR